MQEKCLWEASAREQAPVTAPLDSDISTQVCVVGGGITGLSTALHLAERGISVSVLEAGRIPTGGSGRNVGLVNAGLWVPPDDIVAALGAEDGERANRVLGEAPARVFELIERYGINCHATRTGTLHLGHNPKGCNELARRRDQLTARGAPVELVTGTDCERLTGTPKIAAALLDKRAGTINPTEYTRGLAQAACAQGAALFTDSSVTGIERDGDRWRVRTAAGSVLADRVVMATNAYTQDDWNWVKHQFFTGHYMQVASKPLSGEVADSILPDRQGAWDTRTVLSSIRRDSEGRLVLGSLGSGERRPHAYLKCWADRVASFYFPALGAVEWEYTWTGNVAFTPDHTLRLFEPLPGILAACGYNGRGVTTGTVVGQGFAQFITTGDDSLMPLPIKTHKAIASRPLWSLAYESGFTLYHVGQCLRVTM
ncbi:L-pipecolate oxidase [Larsenimonas rhizosphaerae]|uniref:L-pipecolate oxidase n=1 Tax=Larsenimonas rhizosphaerae TaxID=2944682 RepID=UPI0020342C4A|nr:FAD-binding oxidoreductase [Larsenimonas rhizosphaerae]MCM2129554.1 FAD-binding oxidoreductase [Larsenimonas rhizosphaerae]